MYVIPRPSSIELDHREPPNRLITENLAAASLQNRFKLPIGPLKSASKIGVAGPIFEQKSNMTIYRKLLTS
jgi:hypothetical protein